jgi:hypothetical protein
VVQGTVLAVKNRLAALAVHRVGRFAIRGLATGGKVIFLQWPLYFIIWRIPNEREWQGNVK